MNDIQKNLTAVKNAIHDAELLYHRQPGSVFLLAVSKGQSIATISAALQAGQQAFGENYLQEALEKIPLLPATIEWHFIGPIQSNKTKKIAEHFHWVHTVSNIKTAERLHNQRPTHLPPLNICLQVNSSHEVSKSGADPTELLPLAMACKQLPHLQVRGLMALPAEKKSFHEQREACHEVSVLWQNLREKGLKMDTLSLGTSHDLAAAIAEGSTLVRIGTKIFGHR